MYPAKSRKIENIAKQILGRISNCIKIYAVVVENINFEFWYAILVSQTNTRNTNRYMNTGVALASVEIYGLASWGLARLTD